MLALFRCLASGTATASLLFARRKQTVGSANALDIGGLSRFIEHYSTEAATPKSSRLVIADLLWIAANPPKLKDWYTFDWLVSKCQDVSNLIDIYLLSQNFLTSNSWGCDFSLRKRKCIQAKGMHAGIAGLICACWAHWHFSAWVYTISDSANNSIYIYICIYILLLMKVGEGCSRFSTLWLK